MFAVGHAELHDLVQEIDQMVREIAVKICDRLFKVFTTGQLVDMF